MVRVIELGQVAAVRAMQVATVGELLGHPSHVIRVHRVVGGTDDKGRDSDVLQVGRTVPILEGSAQSKLAWALHGDVDILVEVRETPNDRLGPLRQWHPAHMMPVMVLEE